MGKLQGRVCLVTGGTSGIGEATVRLFLHEGARVSFTGRRNSIGEALENELCAAYGSGACMYINADHMKLEDCVKSVDRTVAKYGTIDVLFNNAGTIYFLIVIHLRLSCVFRDSDSW
eukprot:TRINITY_DN3399_c0_g1_i13.p1 TRINITY_DN3399_c0_g1~~TRINITY_DN3399_c0_g1_i13.p1  ORF type:complete len:117 (-),score=14.41 TRINITY_DN3399_c0_g1_i13:695-1045(-)